MFSVSIINSAENRGFCLFSVNLVTLFKLLLIFWAFSIQLSSFSRAENAILRGAALQLSQRIILRISLGISENFSGYDATDYFKIRVFRCQYLWMLNSWRFSRYNALIYWLVHGHMTSNNETVYCQIPWAGNIAKTMTSNGKQFTITPQNVYAAARYVVAGISASFSKFAFVLLWHRTNHFVSVNTEIRGKQNSLFPSSSETQELLAGTTRYFRASNVFGRKLSSSAGEPLGTYSYRNSSRSGRIPSRWLAISEEF